MRRFALAFSPSALALALALAFAAGGCDAAPGAADPPLGWSDGLAASAAAAALSVDHEAELRFHGDWNHTVANAPILAGGRLRIVYDPVRLPSCRATRYGMDAWSILAWYRWGPDAEFGYVALRSAGALVEATLDVPEDASGVELYFHANDAYGCQEWDSDFEANYRFDVTAPAAVTTATFGADWSEATDGPVVQGGLLRLDYAPSRLRACRATYNGGRTWNIFASWVFEPGGQTGSVALYEGDYFAGEGAIHQPQLQVPDDATAVELWFSNSDRAGCTAWDSDFGANYRLAVEPPEGAAAPRVGWAGDWDFVVFHREPGTHHGDRDPAWYWDRMSGAETASWVEVQVWIPGVTDRAYGSDADRRAAAAGVRAEAVTDAFAGAGPDGWGTVALDFARQQGNNFVYRFRFWTLRYAIYHDPPIPDGAWRYYARFSTDDGATWFEAGRDDERTRRFVVAADQDCDLFPDNPPDECPQARTVGWAGNWGSYRTHACDWRGDLEDPVTFRKSGVGHDCMTVTADVWVEGLTDGFGDPIAIRAEVETDIGFAGGPLATPATYTLGFDGRSGNDFRYRWHLGEHVARADRGDYRYRFRFSADGGASWTVIGAEDGGWRTLRVRNDSTDTGGGGTSVCDGIQYWGGATATYPQCLDYAIAADHDAAYCELYVNAFGDGQFSHNGAWANWYEAYVRVGANDGAVQNVGMWVGYGDGEEVLSIGAEIEPDYWLTGFTYATNQAHSGATPGAVEVHAVAFFVDVRRATGAVVRLWQSGGGANYAPADIFAVPGYEHGIGLGSIEYADEAAALFDTKRTCQ